MSLLVDAINNSEDLYTGDLRYYFKQLFYSRGANNPYHNIRHSLDVFLKGYDAIKYYGNIPMDDARALLIACMLHDFNHSGRAGNDDLNIELAIRGIDKILHDKDSWLRGTICDLIKQTEFGPEGHVDKRPDFYGKIMRDADLSQACSTAWIRLVVFGLAKEMQLPPATMLRMQADFLSKVKFESEWGKEKFTLIIAEKIQEAKDLVAILDWK